MSVIEVQAPDPAAAQQALSATPEVLSVTQLGLRLRVLVPDSIPAPEALVSSALDRQGLQATVSRVDPSLEDVFVSVTLKKPGEARAA